VRLQRATTEEFLKFLSGSCVSKERTKRIWQSKSPRRRVISAYSAAAAKKAAMSKIKPAANQRSSVGMTEIVGHASAGSQEGIASVCGLIGHTA
jgi:hypothetical protein